jgi:hypothetical protein
MSWIGLRAKAALPPLSQGNAILNSAARLFALQRSITGEVLPVLEADTVGWAAATEVPR